MSVQTLFSARAGLEASRGADTTPTRLIYFDTATHDQKIAIQRPKERRASFVQAFRSYPGIERNTLKFGGDVTYDDLIWWLNLHVKAVAAGTGAGADKTWTFLPTHTSDDLKSTSVQFGYTDGIGATRPAWKLIGLLGNELSITVTKSAPWSFESTLLTASAATQITAFTGALSDRAVVSALGTTTQMYIDPTTIGTTADNDILEAKWSLSNGFVYLDTLNNSAVAQEIDRTEPKDWKLELTRYYRNDTELDALIAGTVRKIRLQTTGPVLGGSAYRIRLDLYGVYDGDQYEKTEVDGLGVEKFVLVPQYDATALTDMTIEVVNASASIT